MRTTLPCQLPTTIIQHGTMQPHLSPECHTSSFGHAAVLPRGRCEKLQAKAWGSRGMVQGTNAAVSFPEDYTKAIKQAQDATVKAIADGMKLVEVEFPTASLSSVAGDAEGANEMTYSLQYLRKFTRAFKDRAERTRIFFPDYQELRVAKYGKSKDPNAGSWDIEAVWSGKTSFNLDYLTKPSGLLDIGIDMSGFNVIDRVQATDEIFIAAYPHFDPRELVAVNNLWEEATKNSPSRHLVTFNAELDRLRNGYYPGIFYPKMAQLTREFLPCVEAAFYIHNFKGSAGGALFRAYPGPWQVFIRTRDGMYLVHTEEERPSLRDVALEILPAGLKALKSGTA